MSDPHSSLCWSRSGTEAIHGNNVWRLWIVVGGVTWAPICLFGASGGGGAMEKSGGVGLTIDLGNWLTFAETKVGATLGIPSVWAWFGSSFVGPLSPLAGPCGL